MNPFGIDKKFYIGESKNGHWASVYTYKPRNEHFLEEKGEIFAVISLKGPRGFNASTAGNLLLDHLHESYFEGKDTSPLICLETAVITTAKKLAEIVDNDQNIGEIGINLEIAAVCVVGQCGYFVNMGNGGMYVFREDNLIHINSALKDPTGDGYFKSASTVINKEDVLLLLTEQAEDSYTKEELLDAVSGFNELPLKNKPVEDESSIALLMMGLELENNGEREVDPYENVEVVSKFIKPDTNEAENYDSDSDFALEDIDEEEYSPKNERFRSAASQNVNVDSNSITPKQPVQKILFNAKKKFNQLAESLKEKKFFDVAKEKFANIKPQDSEDTTFVYILNTIKTNATKLFIKFRQLFWYDFLQMEQGIYLKNARKGTNWRFVVFLGVVALLILMSTGWMISKRSENARKTREVSQSIDSVSAKIKEIEPKINSILGVVEVYNREKQNYINQINQEREKLNAASKFESRKNEIDTLMGDLKKLEDKLSRKVSTDDVVIVTDFVTKAGEKANPSDIEIVDGRVYVSDQGRGVIYSMDYNGADLKEITTNLNGPKSLSVQSDGELVGADSNASEPFFSIAKNNGEIKRFTGILSQNLNSITQIETFNIAGTERIYFHKTGGNPVEYISQVGSAYAGALMRVDDTSFSSARDLEISDGKLYILVPGRGVVRLVGDDIEQYSIFGLSSTELSGLNNSTAVDVGGLYVVYGNSTGKSIVFTTKSRGEDIQTSDFIAQIAYTGDKGYLGNIKEVKIDYTTGDIFVLDGTKLLKFKMDSIQQFIY